MHRKMNPYRRSIVGGGGIFPVLDFSAIMGPCEFLDPRLGRAIEGPKKPESANCWRKSKERKSYMLIFMYMNIYIYISNIFIYMKQGIW